MPITAFDHYTIRCADLDKSWAFYRDTLGLRVEPRQVASGIPAAIGYLANEWLVHLFQATPEQDAIFARMQPSDDETAQWRTGRMQHIAVNATGLAEMRARLQQQGAAFRERSLGERYQIITNDPDGTEIEINFAGSEAG
jgi:catechol 2,3-dioxygenase-like lactoylglutathione lyase family enzyme